MGFLKNFNFYALLELLLSTSIFHFHIKIVFWNDSSNKIKIVTVKKKVEVKTYLTKKGTHS